MRPAVTFPPFRFSRRAVCAGVLSLAVAGCAGQAAAAVAPTPAPEATTTTTTITEARPPVAPVPAPVGLPAGTVEAVGPATESGGGTPSIGTVTTGTAAAGMAYPYPLPYAGTPPVAPDHTILVTGAGRATMKPDESNRAAAERAALADALEDARNQADAVARATGVSIEGVLSVSVSVAQGWGVIEPMVMPESRVDPSTVPDPTLPDPAVPASLQLDVSVTVAYTIG